MTFLKSINSRLKSCKAVEQAVLNHGRRVALALEDRMSPLLDESEASPDFEAVQQLLLKRLLVARDAMVQAEGIHVNELANDAEPRKRRDGAFSALGDRILDLRRVFVGLYRPANVESLGFPARLARDPAVLLRQGEHLLEQLSAPDRELPPSRFEDVELPCDALVQSLVPKVEELHGALEAVGRELKRAQATQVDRDRAVGEFDDTFLWVARTLEALYSLAGETELAARVRPSLRRPGRTEQQVAEAESEPASSEEEPAPSETA